MGIYYKAVGVFGDRYTFHELAKCLRHREIKALGDRIVCHNLLNIWSEIGQTTAVIYLHADEVDCEYFFGYDMFRYNSQMAITSTKMRKLGISESKCICPRF